jgi:hypothetical protein
LLKVIEDVVLAAPNPKRLMNDFSTGSSPIERLREILRSSRHAVVFTGAGISTDSGIPDYRSPGGTWSKFRPIEFDEFMASEEARREYWRRKWATHQTVMLAKPNSGHLAIAELVRVGKVAAGCTKHQAFREFRSSNFMEIRRMRVAWAVDKSSTSSRSGRPS